MSIAVIIVSTTLLKSSTSNFPSWVIYFIRLSDARLQALLSICIYSEHGFEALIRPVLGQVCQSFIVVSYCIPGSALCQAASAIQAITSRAFFVSIVSLLVAAFKSQEPSEITACMNSSETLTELLAF